MKIKFTHPLSDSRHYHGELEVQATVDGQDVEIDHVILVDKFGRRNDATYLVTEWGQMYNMLCDMAINNAVNSGHPELEDFTMNNQ